MLVVDDGLDAVHSMALLIKMMGHEVQFAINGFAALECARKFKPENVRIIAISGCSDEDTRRRVQEAGAEEFVSKPIDPIELERLLEKS